MAAVRDGDVERLGVLFERHHARLHAFCYRLTRSADDADDLVQAVFLRVLRYRASFRGESSFTTWLFRLAYNAANDQWKRGRNEEPIDAQRPAPAADPPLDDRLVRLDEAMARLAPDSRAALVLKRYDDLHYDAIAQVLGCTPAAARVRVHRALNDLKEIYRDIERRDRSAGRHVEGTGRPADA
jgi:RNA polymerase sigma factor (sigma-70 family)